VRASRDALRRGVGLAAAIAGAALLLGAATVTARGWIWQARQAPRFSPVTGPSVDAAKQSAFPARRPPQRGDAVALLRLPRLGIETVVVEGADWRSLSLGPGHLEGSALPGARDNCVIAGHRDGPFGRLRRVERGDVVEIADPSRRVARYRVESVDVVDKDDTRPIAPSRESRLTLVTCYPFDYVGPAPRRFVVRAALLD